MGSRHADLIPFPREPRKAEMPAEYSIEDAERLIPILRAGIDREIAVADAHYTRGRNVIALAASLFVAAQAAFITTLDKKNDIGTALVTVSERGHLIYLAVASVALLISAIGVLTLWLDRPRSVDVLGPETIEAWPRADRPDEPLANYLVDCLITEHEDWVETNTGRTEAGFFVKLLAGLSAACTLSQFGLLYIHIT